MTYKRIRKSFLLGISFLAFGILFSCKNPNKTPGNSTEEETEFSLTFGVSPEDAGSIVATVDGVPIESGAKVGKDKEVILTLTINNVQTHELERWNGAAKDKDDPLKAKVKIFKDTTVTAKLKIRTPDPDLVLSSLSIFDKGLDISNLNDIKTEVEYVFADLAPNNVVAMFTYGDSKKPTKIDVSVDKEKLEVGNNTIKLSVEGSFGNYKKWEQEVKINRKDGGNSDVPNELKLDAIEFSTVIEKDGRPKGKPYKLVNNFESGKRGPYTIDEAQTAYIDIKVKAAKPSSGDISVELTNTTTYISPVTLSRNASNENYFNPKRVALSKGYNIIEIKVEASGKDTTYEVVVYYAGGPDPNTLPMQKRKIIPGVYCPIQRKELEGEVEDKVWLILIAGW